jgi:oligoendopeptidase F
VTARWDTTALYPDDEHARAAGAALLAGCDRFARDWRGRVAALTPTELAAAVTEYEGLYATLRRLTGYGTARFIVALEDDESADLSAFTDAVAGEAGEALAFLVEEWCAIPAEVAEQRCAAAELARYRAVLLAAREPEPGSTADPGLDLREPAAADAWAALYDLVTGQITVEVAGAALDLDQALALARSPEPATRRTAVRSLHAGLAARSDELAHCLDTVVADRLVVDEARGIDSARAERDAENGLTAEQVDTALGLVGARVGISHDWYARKAARLGVDRLDFADAGAPPGRPPSIGFDRARAVVTAAFGALRPDLAEVVDRIFAERRVDALPGPGRLGSSLCVPCGSAPPFVLVNFADGYEDALTLAHEIGHAVHYTLAAQHQGCLGADPPTLVGEVVAAFAELLAADQLRAAGDDPVLAALHAETLLDKVFRQSALTAFEDDSYAERAAGSVLTAGRLDAAWLARLRASYGDAIELGPEYGSGWALVPHFFRTRYYNYSYVLATLIALLLHGRLGADREAAATAFGHLLTIGGTEPAPAQLRDIGIDLSAPTTWTTALDHLAELSRR